MPVYQWNNNLDVSTVGGVFSGIIDQLNYLKQRVDDVSAASSQNEGGGGIKMEEATEEFMKLFATKTDVSDVRTEVHIEIEELKKELSKKDEKHLHLTMVVEKQQKEIFALQSALDKLQKDVVIGDESLRESIDAVREDMTDFQETVDTKFGDVFSTMRSTEAAMQETVDGIHQEVDVQSKKVDAALTRVTKMGDALDAVHGQFKFIEGRVSELLRVHSELRHDHDETNSSHQELRIQVEELSMTKADAAELSDKADVSALNLKADTTAIVEVNASIADNDRKQALNTMKQMEDMKTIDERLTKRIDFIMNIVRDLQTEASAEADEDARLKCLACNKPIGNMSEDTPYKKDKMMSTMDLKKKGEVDRDASPERRRPISRGPAGNNTLGTPFEPSGRESLRPLSGPGAKLKRIYATPAEVDPLAKGTLHMPEIPHGKEHHPRATAESTLRLSTAETMRRSASAADGFEGYMTIGKHLSYTELSGAIAGYPSLTGGLIPESKEYQKKRPGTAPARRARESTSSTNQ